MEEEKKVLMVCCLVGFLGILSASTGFGAEATRIKGSEVQFITATQCKYPPSPALPLGLTAAVTLMVAHVIINVSAGCCCCRRRRNHPYSLNSLGLFIVSWLTFTIAFLLLLTGAALNDDHGEGGESSLYIGSYYYCFVVKPGVFAGGAVLSLASVSFGIMYYLLTLSEVKSSSSGNGHLVGAAGGNGNPRPSQGGHGHEQEQGGIAMMGQPRFPPQPQGGAQQDPVFVHEDTYMRRHFT